MSTAILLAAALLSGLAVLIAVWAGRSTLTAKFNRDAAWVRDTYARFYPEPINARTYTGLFYGMYVLWLVLLMLALPSLIFAIVVWIISLFLPRLVVAWLWRRRLRKVDGQIPQTIATLSNSMRAGLTLVQAITRISEQAPEPIRTEFKLMANQYSYGADMETVIRNAKARLNLPNFNLFASALVLNREMGGDISETLTRISKSLDKLREMRKTVEAHTSEGRTNIKVLIAAPFVILLVMYLINRRGVTLLFTTAPGIAILALATLFAVTGVYIAHRITRTEI
ncbi:MAG TPA: type II secretion system F family protein [Phycisphaerae bacterium]|jgi:Flp pilus assembly protein TadB|nr:type II secretion system F family protein [Phycisphaerae bacterium]